MTGSTCRSGIGAIPLHLARIYPCNISQYIRRYRLEKLTRFHEYVDGMMSTTSLRILEYQHIPLREKSQCAELTDWMLSPNACQHQCTNKKLWAIFMIAGRGRNAKKERWLPLHKYLFSYLSSAVVVSRHLTISDTLLTKNLLLDLLVKPIFVNNNKLKFHWNNNFRIDPHLPFFAEFGLSQVKDNLLVCGMISSELNNTNTFSQRLECRSGY